MTTVVVDEGHHLVPRWGQIPGLGAPLLTWQGCAPDTAGQVGLQAALGLCWLGGAGASAWLPCDLQGLCWEVALLPLGSGANPASPGPFGHHPVGREQHHLIPTGWGGGSGSPLGLADPTARGAHCFLASESPDSSRDLHHHPGTAPGAAR